MEKETSQLNGFSKINSAYQGTHRRLVPQEDVIYHADKKAALEIAAIYKKGAVGLKSSGAQHKNLRHSHSSLLAAKSSELSNQRGSKMNLKTKIELTNQEIQQHKTFLKRQGQSSRGTNTSNIRSKAKILNQQEGYPAYQEPRPILTTQLDSSATGERVPPEQLYHRRKRQSSSMKDSWNSSRKEIVQQDGNHVDSRQTEFLVNQMIEIYEKKKYIPTDNRSEQQDPQQQPLNQTIQPPLEGQESAKLSHSFSKGSKKRQKRTKANSDQLVTNVTSDTHTQQPQKDKPYNSMKDDIEASVETKSGRENNKSRNKKKKKKVQRTDKKNDKIGLPQVQQSSVQNVKNLDMLKAWGNMSSKMNKRVLQNGVVGLQTPINYNFTKHKVKQQAQTALTLHDSKSKNDLTSPLKNQFINEQGDLYRNSFGQANGLSLTTKPELKQKAMPAPYLERQVKYSYIVHGTSPVQSFKKINSAHQNSANKQIDSQFLMGIGQLCASKDIYQIKQQNLIKSGSVVSSTMKQSNNCIVNMNEQLGLHVLSEHKPKRDTSISPKLNLASKRVSNEAFGGDSYHSLPRCGVGGGFVGLSPDRRQSNKTPLQKQMLEMQSNVIPNLGVMPIQKVVRSPNGLINQNSERNDRALEHFSEVRSKEHEMDCHSSFTQEYSGQKVMRMSDAVTPKNQMNLIQQMHKTDQLHKENSLVQENSFNQRNSYQSHAAETADNAFIKIEAGSENQNPLLIIGGGQVSHKSTFEALLTDTVNTKSPVSITRENTANLIGYSDKKQGKAMTEQQSKSAKYQTALNGVLENILKDPKMLPIPNPNQSNYLKSVTSTKNNGVLLKGKPLQKPVPTVSSMQESSIQAAQVMQTQLELTGLRDFERRQKLIKQLHEKQGIAQIGITGMQVTPQIIKQKTTAPKRVLSAIKRGQSGMRMQTVQMPNRNSDNMPVKAQKLNTNHIDHKSLQQDRMMKFEENIATQIDQVGKSVSGTENGSRKNSSFKRRRSTQKRGESPSATKSHNFIKKKPKASVHSSINTKEDLKQKSNDRFSSKSLNTNSKLQRANGSRASKRNSLSSANFKSVESDAVKRKASAQVKSPLSNKSATARKSVQKTTRSLSVEKDSPTKGSPKKLEGQATIIENDAELDKTMKTDGAGHSEEENDGEDKPNPYSFRPRAPLPNPEMQEAAERQRLLQIREEALQKAKDYSRQNKFIPKFKWAVVKGNNANLIRKCMAVRADRWEETTSFDKLFNFKWQPVSRGLNFNQLNSFGVKQLSNHIENHDCITTKHKLFENLAAYCEQKKMNVFKYMPLTFVLSTGDAGFAGEVEKFITYFNRIKEESANLNLSSTTDQQLLVKTVNKKSKSMKLQLPNKMFVAHRQMDKGSLISATKIMQGDMASRYELSNSYLTGSNVWILKVTGENRGIGIHVFNKIEDFSTLIRDYLTILPFTDNICRGVDVLNKMIGAPSPPKKDFNLLTGKADPKITVPKPFKFMKKSTFPVSTIQENVPVEDTTQDQSVELPQPQPQQTPQQSAPKQQKSATVKSSSYVIQKYMENPLLIDNRKFDIRVWVLVCQNGNCFFFNEGYVRTSSSEYSLKEDEITKPEIHLTNNAVQRNLENYGKFEDGNILSFDALTAEVAKQRPEVTDYCKSRLVPDLKEKVLVSLEAVRNYLKVNKGCFELFGYDFIIDNDLVPWMIEINTNPCLDESNKYLTKLLPRMINDALRLTVDVNFGPRKGMAPYKSEEINVFPLDGYENAENLWSLLGNLNQRPDFEPTLTKKSKSVKHKTKKHKSPERHKSTEKSRDLYKQQEFAKQLIDAAAQEKANDISQALGT